MENVNIPPVTNNDTEDLTLKIKRRNIFQRLPLSYTISLVFLAITILVLPLLVYTTQKTTRVGSKAYQPPEAIVDPRPKIAPTTALSCPVIDCSGEKCIYQIGANCPDCTCYSSDADGLSNAIEVSAKQRKPLLVEKATYTIDSQLVIPSNTSIDFNGSTLIRAAGSKVFDMLINDRKSESKDISISNLVIDGNKDTDKLLAKNTDQRFAGLSILNASQIRLNGITVVRTVNAEDTAGIYLESCVGAELTNIEAYDNDRTGIIFDKTKATLRGARLYNNLGSGISVRYVYDSVFSDIVAYNNGYTNIGINGLRSKISNIVTYNSMYSGLTLGHSGNPADDTVAENVTAYGNTFEGITIMSSRNVSVKNSTLYGNKRNNLRILEGSHGTRIDNVQITDSAGGSGILIQNGNWKPAGSYRANDYTMVGTSIYQNQRAGAGGTTPPTHKEAVWTDDAGMTWVYKGETSDFPTNINNSTISGNSSSGIYVDENVSVAIYQNKILGNGVSNPKQYAGIELISAIKSEIKGNTISNGSKDVQAYGIRIRNSRDIAINCNSLTGNSLGPTKLMGSNQNVTIDSMLNCQMRND